MSKMMMKFGLLLVHCLVCTAALSAVQHRDTSCTSLLDCALSPCVDGQCVCGPGWKHPESVTGTPCSAFDLAPADEKHPGYKNESWPSWGGHPVQWPKSRGGDGRWHLFTPQFANECSVDNWVRNSFVVHAVSDNPNGPWEHHDVAVGVWAHGPQAVLHPDGTWLLYFVGGWHYPHDTWKNCSATAKDPTERAPWSKGIHWPGPPTAPAFGPTADGCGPDSNAGCGIRLAHSRSPYGPWTIQNVTFSNGHDSHILDCARSDPAPYVLPNGTVVMAFGAGDCHGGMETIGLGRTKGGSADWRGPYELITGNAVANLPNCPTGNFAEDPNLWFDGKGWHLIAHGLCSWEIPGRTPPSFTDLYALHAWSLDGVDWTVAMDSATNLTVNAWSKHVAWSNKSTTYASRMERPQVILDATNTRPIFLTTAVCPGGDSVGGAACHYTIPSWNLYRPIHRGV